MSLASSQHLVCSISAPPTVAVLFVEGILLVYLIGEREYRIFFPATLRQSVSLLTKNRDHLIIIQVIGVTNENLL